MVKLAYKLEITLPFNDYTRFFEIMYTHCDDDENTYKSWDCTPNKRTICQSITSMFTEVLDQLENADEKETDSFTHFTK